MATSGTPVTKPVTGTGTLGGTNSIPATAKPLPNTTGNAAAAGAGAKTAGTAGGGSTAPATGNTNPLSTAQQDAYTQLVNLFDGYGLSSLAPDILSYVQQGYDSDTISIMLQQTPAYQQRFAGNAIRQKNGLAVLSPADYLSTEASYRQILSSAGLPAGFYDSPADFTNWIGGDVSATEIQDRVNLAEQDVLQAPQSTKDALTQLYGISQSDLTAYFLDQSKSLPLLQVQAQAAQIGGAALQAGLGTSANDELFARMGVTTSQAQQGYQQLAGALPTMQAIAQRFGTSWDQNQGELAQFEPNATVGGVNVTQKQTQLQDQEKALFNGNTGSVSYIGLNAVNQQQ